MTRNGPNSLINLARRLEVDESTLRAWLRGRPEFTRTDHEYSPECVQWLEEKAKALHKIPLKGTMLSFPELAAKLGCGRVKARQLAEADPEVQIRKRRDERGRIWDCVSPNYIPRLRRQLPPKAKGTQLTATQVARQSGWSVPVAQRYLGDSGTEARTPERGMRTRVYDKAAWSNVPKRDRNYPPAGDWYTVRRMVGDLGRSPKWVKFRLDHYYAGISETRIDDTGIPREHWPKEVYTDLLLDSLLQRLGLTPWPQR
jgi:hypothetical protein